MRAADPVRTVGLGVSVINENSKPGIARPLVSRFAGQALGYGAMFGKMLNQNDQYEVAEGYFNDLDVFTPSKVWQPIDTQRIPEWDAVSNLCKTGQLTPGSNPGQGDARSASSGSTPTAIASMAHRATSRWYPVGIMPDSIGYNPDDTGREITSWAELFSEDFAGSVALLNIPQIGVMDAALGVEALGLLTFGDKGNMTRDEIDFLIDFLIEKKQAGHFRAFWETFGQSVNLMVSGEVVLESMWSPAVTAIKAEGVRCVYASPKEGMRGWHGGLAISAATSGAALDQGLRIRQLVAVRLGRRVCRASGLLHVGARQCAEAPRLRRVGLLVHGQAGGAGAARSVRHHHRREGRSARRRLLRGPLPQHRRMELG